MDPEILEDPIICDPEINLSVQAVQAVVCSLFGVDIPALLQLESNDSDSVSDDDSDSEYEMGSDDSTPEVGACDSLNSSTA